MNIQLNKIKRSLSAYLLRTMLFITFVYSASNANAQCAAIDGSFTISNASPIIGEEVVFTYTGIDFCPDCTYELFYGALDDGIGGESFHSGGFPDPIIVSGDIIGKHIYSDLGTFTITLAITNEADGCVETVTSSLTVGLPPKPFGMYLLGGAAICFTDQDIIYEVETTPLGGTGYTVSNVAWNMGDSPDIYNTVGLTYDYDYLEDGTHYITAVITFTNGIDTYNETVINIVNKGTPESFTGTEPFFITSKMNGDPTFNVNINYVLGVPQVDFLYTGTPFPQPLEDVELGWGIVDWTVTFKINGIAETVLPVFAAELNLGDQIIATKIGLTPGTYTALMDVSWVTTQCGNPQTVVFVIPGEPCDSCNSFKPDPNERYWMSAWVKVDQGQVKTYNTNGYEMGEIVDPATLEDAFIEFFYSGPNTSTLFYPTGEIIDGWQRIVGEFFIPDGTYDLVVNLFADDDFDTFFDDIRIHPFNGSMKSYVYDGETFWLTSELDDNNYATFYEYDQEGGLIRIKKETARGIVTIQETRSGTLKSE